MRDVFYVPWMRDYWIGHSLFATIIAGDHSGRLAANDQTIGIQDAGPRAAWGNGSVRHRGAWVLPRWAVDRGAIAPLGSVGPSG